MKKKKTAKRKDAKTVRLGLIGAGGISGAHINAVNKIEGAKFVAVCDLREKAARERAKLAGGAKVYTNYEKMLDREELDAVYICTPPTVRRGPIEAAVERGLPVFCEKPAANSVETAREISDFIERRRGGVTVGYVLRHMEIVGRLMELLADDRIAIISSRYVCPVTLNYIEGNPAALWFYKMEISGGPIMDQATHSMDLIRYYAGEVAEIATFGTNKFLEKSEDYTVEDSYAVAMRLTNGAAATHAHTWAHARWGHTHAIFGAKRAYLLDIVDGSLTVTEGAIETIFKPAEDIFFSQAARFVEMVALGDFSASRSTYADATRTLLLTVRCLDSMNARSFVAVE